MRAFAVLERLCGDGITLSVRGEELVPRGRHKDLTESLASLVREYKPEIMEVLKAAPRPYIDGRGCLVIPMNAEPKYRWWSGGQSIRETLVEIGASDEVIGRYWP